MNTSNLWLCLYFPDLAVDVFCRDSHGRGTDRPVVVLDRHRVFAMNQLAADLDIRIGSSMGTAWSVSEQLVSFERNEQKELATLERLSQWAYRFTPSVSLQYPDCLLLEISGCLKLFKGLDALKQQVHDGLDELGFRVVSAVNVTPLAALYAARGHLRDNTRPDQLRHSLARLPVSGLEVDAKIKTALQQMGVVQLKQLLELPADGLNRRFGVFFSDHLDRLTGRRPDPRMYISSQPRFCSELTFMSDVSNLASLVFPLKRLLGEFEDFLRARQLLVSRFRITLSHRHHGHRHLPVYLANADNDARMFLALAQLRLDSVNDMPEVDTISLSANTFADQAEEAQGPRDLFQGGSQAGFQTGADIEKQTRLLNMLTARLGRDACFGLALADDHRPEKAWQTTAPTARQRAASKKTAIECDINPRPAWLLPEARPLKVVNQQPCISGPLELLQGPERIDFGWWDGDTAEPARDYYIARSRDGALYWIYQRTHTHTHTHTPLWYLHGIFS